MFFQVFLFQHSTGQSSTTESNSRETRQILLGYHYPWSGYPVQHYDHANQFNYNNFNPYYQERIKEPLVDSLTSDALEWIRNLNEDEQDSLTAWSLASAAVESLTQGKYAGVLSFNPGLTNVIESPQNRDAFYG